MHRLANFSLANRALIALVTVFVLIFGLISTTRLKQELIPSVSFPQAIILASYPGASPEVVEQAVTVPIEQAIGTVQNVESSQSTSSNGSATVTVTMKYGTNMNAVQQDLQAAISRIQSMLPEGVDTQVITGGFDSIPVLVLAASSDQEPQQLAAALNSTTVAELTRIDGVRSVEILGAPKLQVLVALDPAKMAAAGLSAAQVSQALAQNGSLVSAGSVTEGPKTLSVTLGKRYASVDDVKAVMVTPTTPNARPVSVGSLATVTQTTQEATSISRTNGRASLTVAISKKPDANTVAVAEAVRQKLPELANQLGSGATFDTVFDQAPFITQSIDDLLTEGGLGLVAAIVVILVFLLSVRSTLVTAVSIPASVLVTLIGLYAFGYSLNILTLGAMTIAIGRVVDDAIVVIENIKRHLSYGEPKLRAILTAVREVATAVTAATITTVAVFAPIALVGGQTGELFRPFALTVTLAMLASLFVSLTIVPVLAYWFLKPPKDAADAETVRARAEAAEHDGWLQKAYVPVLKWSLKHPLVVLLIGVLLLGGTGALATQLKSNFLGDMGQNSVSVTQKFDAGTSLAEQDRRAKVVEEALTKVPGVQVVQSSIGSSDNPFFGPTGEAATFNLTTDPDGDQAAIQDQIRTVLDGITGEDLSVAQSAAAGSSTIDVVIKAPDTKRLQDSSDAVVAALRGVTTVTDVTSTLASNRETISVVLKQPQAAQAGFTDQMLAQLLQTSIAPQRVAQVQQGNGTTVDVTVQSGKAPASMAELQQLRVPTRGGMVPLSQVATVQRVSVPTSISHFDGQRSVTVSVTPSSDDLNKAGNDVRRALEGLNLPQGATAEVGGVVADQEEAFAQLGLALLAAIAIVYVVMVATFKSLVQPLILAVSIPFAATGALLALLITDTPLGIPSMIGVLMLVGIVVTNAIVLIDLVNHYRAQGERVDQALMDGARRRLRPIVMTALATIAALTPMALGLSGGGVFISKPLAVVVIGGLVSSTLLTLILVPVLYRMVEARRERRGLAKGTLVETEDGRVVSVEQQQLLESPADESPAEQSPAAQSPAGVDRDEPAGRLINEETTPQRADEPVTQEEAAPPRRAE